MTDEELDIIVGQFARQRKAFSGFLSNVRDFFDDNDALIDDAGKSVVHSLKSRLKDPVHLREKIKRKSNSSAPISSENLFTRVTDLCGVRVMHLRRSDFTAIHQAICAHVEAQHWFFNEPPKAYTWDPEYKSYFDHLQLQSEIKEFLH